MKTERTQQQLKFKTKKTSVNNGERREKTGDDGNFFDWT